MAREVPQVYPRFGYLLDHNGAPPGVLLAVHSPPDKSGGSPFRNHAPMLTSIVPRLKERAHWTWST